MTASTDPAVWFVLAWLAGVVLLVVLGVAVVVTITKRAARDLRRRGHRAAARLAWIAGILIGLQVFRQQLHSPAARILAAIIVVGVMATAFRTARQPR